MLIKCCINRYMKGDEWRLHIGSILSLCCLDYSILLRPAFVHKVPVFLPFLFLFSCYFHYSDFIVFIFSWVKWTFKIFCCSPELQICTKFTLSLESRHTWYLIKLYPMRVIKSTFFCHYKNNETWCYNLFLRNNF